MSALVVVSPDTDEWAILVEELLRKFSPGDLISHDYLRRTLRIRTVDIEDFAETDDFIKALNDMQFEYMGLIDKLREELLLTESYYLQNVKGQGYRILPPKEQHQFAYSKAINEIKQVLKQSTLIMSYVRVDEIDADERAKASNLSAKLSTLAQMFMHQRRR